MSAMGAPSDVLGDRYELQALLGRGGMATVYRATDRRLERAVAVKLLDTDVPTDPDAVRRFRAEARTAARLGHRHIVGVHDVASHDGSWFIVMEFVDGPTLAEAIARYGELAQPAAIRIATNVADALACAHAHGVIHRDVKPSNVLFDSDGTVKVADFGIARAMADDATMVRGSPHYLAPEQARGLPADPRSDIYALGCVLFEMLAGRPPFVGTDATDVIRRHVTEQAPALDEFRGDVSPALAATIARMLDKDPDRRPTSMAAIRDALTRDQPDVAVDPTPTRALPADATVLLDAAAAGGGGTPAGGGTAADRGDTAGASSPPANGDAPALRRPAVLTVGTRARGRRARSRRARRRRLLSGIVVAAAIILAAVVGFVLGRPQPQPAAANEPAASPSPRPTMTALTATTDPPGLRVVLGDDRGPAPVTADVVVGDTLRVSAPSPQTVDGVTYQFELWSDHGARSHVIDATNDPPRLTARFVPVEPEMALDGADIGDPGIGGSTIATDDGYVVVGGGGDIWDGSDQFHYASTAVDGDTAITIRVSSLTGADPWAKAGVMVRDGSGTNARNVLLATTPGNGVTFQYRAEAGGESEDRSGGAASPEQWLRLIRRGDEVTGLTSVDGQSWRRVASVDIDLGPQALVGLAVTAHDDTASSEATFDQLEISDAEDLPEQVATTGCPDGLWAAEYYAGTELAGTPVARGCDDRVAFDWGLGGPGGAVPADQFSARWEQTVTVAAGTYTFTARSDDGVRVWVDGELVLDDWSDHAPQTVSAEYPLDGTHTLRVEYYDNIGGAMVQLDW